MTLKEMINTVIHINNRIYKQHLEKQSINALIIINKNNR